MEGDRLKRIKKLITWDLERIESLMDQAGEISADDIPYSFLHQAWIYRKKQLEIVKDLITLGETEKPWPGFGYIRMDLHLLKRR